MSMFKIILRSIAIFSLCCQCLVVSAQKVEVKTDGFDFTCSSKHPRLLFSDDEFKQVRRSVNSCKNIVLQRLHDSYMEYADECVNKDTRIEYTPNSSGKLLNVSRDALGQIGACAYAYRITKDPKYAARVESILNDVCHFETWHPEHYLDVSEMSLAVALGYDWCYGRLKPETRKLCEKTISEFSFDTAQDKKWRKKFRNGTNWGQVLNAGLISTAIAFYETDPQRCSSLLARAVKDNADYVARNYAPDGISPEGPGYWGYGTSMQLIINAALEHSYGTDFGLSECQGFEKSANYITFATGSSGDSFNYSDGTIKKSQPALWYFAYKFKDPSLAYNEVKFIEATPKYQMRMRFGFVYVPFASKVLSEKAVPPTSLLFSGQGSNPLVMARTGWSSNDLYLGVKGGGAKNNHAHLDAGSFVFDAYGKRWLCEPGAPQYAKTEKALRSIEKSLWKMDQASMRWKIFGYNNLQHNTITINGKDHLVSGKGELVDVFDEPQRRGGRFNLTSLFSDQADSVSRTVCIVDGKMLEIEDYVKALPDKDANVYCNFTTKADVVKSDNGIILKFGGTQMKVVSDNPDVSFSTGMVVPEGVPECLEPFYSKVNTRFFGISILVPAGKEARVRTTVSKP